MNRYSRDELIRIALDMAQVSGLSNHDVPDGVVQPDAFSLQWLQDIVDWWYHTVPFSVTVKRLPLNCVANQNYIEMPQDFIVDVRNGYRVQTIVGDIYSLKRSKRVDYQKFMNWEDYYRRSANVLFPMLYCVIGVTSNGRQQMLITPTPTVSTVGELSYYALPPLLQAGDVPMFPADKITIEYIRIRALEFSRIYDPGTAERYCDRLLNAAKASGLMNEPESDDLPLDDLSYRSNQLHNQYSPYTWMGPI